MIITRKRRRDKINIFLNNRSLEQVEVMKYLGIYFDSRHLFYKKVEHVAEKSRALTYMLNRTDKLQWGLGHKSIKNSIRRSSSTPNDLRYSGLVGREQSLKSNTSRRCKAPSD